MIRYSKRTIIFLAILISAGLIFLRFSNMFSLTKNREEVKEESVLEMYVLIDGVNYVADLEDNDTVKEFLDLLPKKYDMSDLNGNEKYTYIEKKLYVRPEFVKEIHKGDIMIFNNNCLVIFYKDFETTYRYTKIGHINNLPDLGSENIMIEFKKDADI